MLLQISSQLRQHFKGFHSCAQVIMLFFYMQGRCSLSYRELEEMAHITGAFIDHSTLARWIIRFTPLIAQQVRKRKKTLSGSWKVDET